MELQKLKQSISDYEREIASLTKGTIEEDIRKSEIITELQKKSLENEALQEVQDALLHRTLENGT